AALLINPGIVVMGQEGTSRLASCGYRGWDIPVLEAAPLGTPVSCNFPAALISSEVCSALNVLISSVHAPSWAMAPGGHYETSSPKIFASGSGRYRPAHGLTLRLGAITPCGSGGDRSGGDGAASNVAKHRLARSRSRSLQKARDRYDPAGHCGRRSGGCGRAHPGRLGV